MLKAVAFDLWETLITDLPEIAHRQTEARIEGLARVLGEAGHGVSGEAVSAAHHETWQACWERYWSRDRDVTARGQVCHFLEALGVDHANASEELLDAVEWAYGSPALVHLPVLVPGACELLDSLRARGLKTGVISNTGRTPGTILRKVLDARELGRRIDASVYSNEVGECKPLPAIFEALRAELGVAFGEMLFVGDNLFADVHGAQQCGMHAVHFVPPSRGMAVGQATRENFDLAPYKTVTSLAEIEAIVDGMLP